MMLISPPPSSCPPFPPYVSLLVIHEKPINYAFSLTGRKRGVSKASSPEPGADNETGADTGPDEARNVEEGVSPRPGSTHLNQGVDSWMGSSRYALLNYVLPRGMQGEEGAGEESSDEMHPGRTYTTCRPLSHPVSASLPAAEAASVPSLPGGSHLLLANENMYIFFRYHR